MRWLLLFALVCLPALAAARPRVAVAPLQGDAGGKVAAVVAEVAGETARVTRPADTKKAMSKLGLSGELDGKAVKKLRTKLGADVLIHGKVEEDGSRNRVELVVSVRGKKTERFTLSFKSATSRKLQEELRDELSRRISEGEGNDDADAEPKEKRKKKKKRRRGDDSGEDEPGARNPVTQAAIRLNAGASATRRTFTYDTTNPMPPRRVGTLSGSGRVEGELYPGSFETLQGLTANLGLAFELDKTFGLGIRVPGQGGAAAPIDKLHVIVGARYRVPFGAHAVAFGASYYRRRYLAERAGPGNTLDMPDVDYSAIAPGAVGRFAVGPKLGLAIAVDLPLTLSAGPIQSGLSYGPAKIIGFDVDAALEYQLAPHYALKAALELSNIMITFDQKMGSQSAVRMVQGATDRNLGLAVTFEVLY